MEKLDESAAKVMKERLTERRPCIARLREIEAQVSRCLGVAEETKEGIMRGDQVS